MIRTKKATRKMRRMLDEARRRKIAKQAARIQAEHKGAILLYFAGLQ